MNIDLTPILQAIVGILAVLITTKLIPWAKSKLSSEKQGALAEWVDIAVLAAEQVFVGPGRGKEKLKYVADFLESKGYSIDMDDTYDSVLAMIEAAVYALNN